MDQNGKTEEYDEEKTVFRFDGGSGWVDIWIDCHWNDLEDPEDEEDVDLPTYYGPDIVKNALHCGRNLSRKDGRHAAWWGGEYILAGDVAGLRERFEALRDGRSNGFEAYPEHNIGGKGEPFIHFSAKRLEDRIWVGLTLHPDNDTEEFDFWLGREELDDLCAYFKRINEWFPPVGPGEQQVLRWGKDRKQEGAEE